MDDKETLELHQHGINCHQEYYAADGRDDIAGLATATIAPLDLSDLGRLDPYYGAIPPVSVMAASGSYDLTSSITWPSANVTVPNNSWSDISNISIQRLNPSNKISLNGKDADIEINGESLCDMIRSIQDRLNILCPDPEMEAEWDELRELRQAYDAKLAQCREKSEMWKALKS